MLQLHYDLGRDLRWFSNLCNLAVTRLSAAKRYFEADDFIAAADYLCCDFRRAVVEDLSSTAHALLAAMIQLERRGVKTYNFAMCFHEQEQHLKKALARVDSALPRKVYLKEFEMLFEQQLLQPTEARAQSSSSDGGGGGSSSSGMLPLPFTLREFESVKMQLPPAFVEDVLSRCADSWIINWLKADPL